MDAETEEGRKFPVGQGQSQSLDQDHNYENEEEGGGFRKRWPKKKKEKKWQWLLTDWMWGVRKAAGETEITLGFPDGR